MGQTMNPALSVSQYYIAPETCLDFLMQKHSIKAIVFSILVLVRQGSVPELDRAGFRAGCLRVQSD